MSSAFNLLNNTAGEYQLSSEEQGEVYARIEKLISSAPVFIFMKGTPEVPLCGFSQNVIQILNRTGKSYKTCDVISDPLIRQSLKTFSNWPTFPQVYIQGQFVGGNDILEDMESSGELTELLNNI